MIKVKKTALLAVLIVISGPLGAMTTTGRQLAQKYPNLSQSALAALRSGNPQVSRQALARTGYLKQPARYRSTYSMPKNQVNKEAFNSSMKQEFAQKYAPHILGLGAVTAGAGTYAGLSLYDKYNETQKSNNIPEYIGFPEPLQEGRIYTLEDIKNSNKSPSRFFAYHNLELLKKGIVDGNRPNMESAYLGNIGINDLECSGADFSGANFKKAIINNSSFWMIKAIGADFSDSEIRGTKFSLFSDLDNAIFSNTKLASDDFGNSKLNGAQFNDAKIIRWANFRDAKLENANFSNVEFQDGERIFGSETVSFENAQLRKANFKNAILVAEGDYNKMHADFENANLEEAQFENANLERANFKKAHLKGANFDKAKLKNVNFYEADLTGADLSQTDITGLRFTFATLKGTKLDTSKLNYEDWLSYKYQNGILA